MATFDNMDLDRPKINMSDLFRQTEYANAYINSKDLVKVSEALDRLLIITGYSEETMVDVHKREPDGSYAQKPCFRMSFYFEDEGKDVPHYIRTEARVLWARLKAINSVNPDLLSSGTIRTMICEGSKKGAMGMTKYYYFAGTE